MYKKILFPTDFSREADHSLLHALKLTGAEDGEVIIQHVVNDYFERLPHWTSIFDVHELQRHVDGHIATEMKRVVGQLEHAGLKIRTVVSKGKPAEEINVASEDEMVDLIVMGPSTGSLTSQVINKGSRPVMAVPPSETNGDGCQRVRRILVAVDFSHRSQKLIDHAFRLRASMGATIYLVYVIEATGTMEAALREAYFSESLDRMRDWAMNQFVNLTPTEAISDRTVHRIVDVGRPGETIAEIAKGVQADLVVIGLQDHSRTEKRLIDAHTEQVLRNEGTTILTLPA